MIPEFTDEGLLPPGIHPATVDEIEDRFGSSSPERVELMQSLRWLIEMVHRDDVLRLIVNGSFVTDKVSPDDVDCVLLGGPTFGQHGISFPEWRSPLPFIHLEIGDPTMIREYVEDVFGFDERLRPKGMIEVLL